jgi:hypothetical protein
MSNCSAYLESHKEVLTQVSNFLVPLSLTNKLGNC